MSGGEEPTRGARHENKERCQGGRRQRVSDGGIIHTCRCTHILLIWACLYSIESSISGVCLPIVWLCSACGLVFFLQMPAIPASNFHDGTLLSKLSYEFGDDFRRRGLAVPFGGVGATLEIYWASICSGSDVVLLDLECIAQYYQEINVNVKFVHRFSCESKPWKQEWTHRLFEERGIEAGCLFERAEELGQTHAYCCLHKRKCPVPGCDLLIAGASCKDFSRSSTNMSPAEVMMHATTPGGSAQTMWALLKYVSLHCIEILLLEDADTLDVMSPAGKSLQTALNVVAAEIRKCGMNPCPLLTDAFLFGLPEERRRFYIVAVREIGSMLLDFGKRPLALVFSCLRENLVQCQREAPCLSEVLLKGDGAQIENLLNERLAKGAEKTNICGKVANIYKDGGVRWGDADLGQELQANIWYGTLPTGLQEVLKYSRAEVPKGQALLRDISNGINKIRYSKVVGGRHVAMCQYPEQLVWVETADQEPRLLLGVESMMIQGFPVSVVPRLVESTSDCLLKTLAGNMMASVLPLAILQSLFVSLAWRPQACNVQRPLAMSEGEVVDAMSCFDTMLSGEFRCEDASESSNVHSLKRRRKAAGAM